MDYQKDYIKLNPTMHLEDAGKKFEQLLPQLEFVKTKTNERVILDIGCGAGAVTKLVKELFPNANIYGVDLSEPMITYANKNNTDKDISFDQKDIFDLDQQLKFDFMYCSDLIEHIDDDLGLLTKLAHHSAYFLVRVPLENSISNRFLRFFRIYDEFSWTNKKYGHVQHYSYNDFQKKIRIAGFRIVNAEFYPIDHVRKHWQTELGRRIAKVLFGWNSKKTEVLWGGGFLSITLETV